MKKRIAFLLALVMCLALCACGNQATNNQSADAPDYATLAEPKNGKEAISVLSCDVASPTEHWDQYDCSFKLQNDVEVTINTLTLKVVYLDRDGTIVHTDQAQELARLLPGQSEVIISRCPEDLNPVECYIDSIWYFDGEENQHQFYLDNPQIFKMS